MITIESLKGKQFHQFPLEVRELISDVQMKFGPRVGTAFQKYLEGQAARAHELSAEVCEYAAEHAYFRGIELKFPEHRFVA
ncbi:MAG TPA: hypothetical protein VMU25_02940 [Candidatus Paceibacterota bacterium]|nr:hypothetical protein [Candidatus Paceibacterota bacterium]